MEYGSDDDDWDPAEIEKVHAAAVDTYAATQQQRTQSHAPLAATSASTIQQYTPPDTLQEDDIDGLVKEKQRFEKLARDKQGELLVLRSNIARTTADHANALDSLQRANKQTVESLRKELDAYKESVVRLETDLTFQRQELRDAKLKARQHTKSSTSASPGNKTSNNTNGNGFPTKLGFEREDSIGPVQGTASRKRKRQSRQTGIEDDTLDEFDLAEQRATQARNVDKSPGPVNGHTDADQTFSQLSVQSRAASPAISREVSQVTEILAKTSVERPTAFETSSHKTEILDSILEAVAPDGTGCLSLLMSIESSQHSDTSIGQSILRAVNVRAMSDLSAVIVLGATKLLVHEFVVRELPVKPTDALLTLLFALLPLHPPTVAVETLSENEHGQSVIIKLQELAEREQDLARKSLYLGAMLQLVEAAEWNEEKCSQLHNPISSSFAKHVLVTTANAQHRILLLETFARLASGPAVDLATHELLEIMTYDIDKDEIPRPECETVRLRTVQCLYCLVVYKTDALARLRTSRHVIPRMIRRLSRELDFIHESSSPTNMPLLRALVKLYHILLKDEDNATSEHHWRHLEIRATHLTSMTRIVYAEEHDGFDAATQDLAMDLLEMAVSPEEGNDIYEIMGGA